MGLRGIGTDRGASRFEAVSTWLGLWIVAGLYLAGWAVGSGTAANATFSVYHLPAYLGLIALVAVVAERLFDRSAGRSSAAGIRSAWRGRTTGERLIVAGTLVLVGFVVADLAWVAVLGIGNGLEARVAPTRLLLPLGLCLVSGGWLMDAGIGGHRAGWLGVVSAATILAATGFALGGWHPVASAWAPRSTAGRDEMRTEVWTMAADGTRQTRIVESGPGEASEPAWSPDGKRLVYAAWAFDANGSRVADLWTVSADGTGAQRVTNDPAWDWLPAWSPDGQWIAFTSRSSPATAQPASAAQPQPGRGPDLSPAQAADWSIFLVKPDGTGRHELSTGGQSMSPVWSRDGTKLAYHGARDGNLDVFVSNADGSGEQRITDDPGDDWSPAWSPDGTRLLFTSNRAGNDDVWVTTATGGSAMQLTHDPADDEVPVWSPDGSRIAFVSDRSGDFEVWSMAADGTDLRNLTRSSGTDDGRWSASWSPDGSRIAFARWSPPPATADPLVRDDLGFLGILLTGGVLAVVLILVDALGGLPLGGLTVALGLSTAMVAAVSGGWRFIPASILAGVLADVVSWRLAGARRRLVSAAVIPAVFVMLLLLTVAIVDGLGWTITLAAGAIVATGLVGFGLGLVSLVGRPVERAA